MVVSSSGLLFFLLAWSGFLCPCHSSQMRVTIRSPVAADRHRQFSICDLQRSGDRVKLYPSDQSLEFSHDGGAVQQVILTAPYAPSRMVHLDSAQQGFPVDVLNIADPFNWVHVAVNLLGDHTCDACPRESYVAQRTGDGPWRCVACPPGNITVRKFCQDHPESHALGLCATLSSAVKSSMHFIQCPPLGTDTLVLQPCDDPTGSKRWVVSGSTPMPRSALECTRLSVCDAKDSYRDSRIAGNNCLPCHDDGQYGMRGQRRPPDSDSVDANALRGWDKEATCQCPAGRFYDVSAEVCMLCSPGKFNDAPGLATECQVCPHCQSRQVYGARHCAACAEGSYWSTELQRCHACPRSFAALRQNPDFSEDANNLKPETMYINTTACGDRARSGQCEKPPSVLAQRSECDAGHESIRYSESEDDVCVRCAAGKFNPTAGVATECKDHSRCSGIEYARESAEGHLNDTHCEAENIGRVFDRYPVRLIKKFNLGVQGDDFTFNGVLRPTLLVEWKATTVISWPAAYPVTIYDSPNLTTAVAEPSTDTHTTTLVVTESQSEGTRLYYRSHEAWWVNVGEIVVVDASNSVEPQKEYLFAEPRTQALLEMPLANCSMPPGQTKNAFYKDALLERWQAGEQLLLPFVGTAPCVYSCKPGARKTRFNCEECGAGTFSAGGEQTDCSLCPVGTSQDMHGSTSCTLCATGKFSENMGSTSCTAHCSIGSGESCHIAGCGPGTHYLIEPDRAGVNHSNCVPCAARGLASVKKTSWEVYGEQHCFSDKPDCTETVANSKGALDDPTTCKPQCADGYFAEYQVDGGEWRSRPCDPDRVSCRPGQYKAAACSNNSNVKCEECEPHLMPLVRRYKGVALNAEQCSELTFTDCRAPGFIMQDLTQRYRAIEGLQVKGENELWSHLKDGACILQKEDERECRENQHFALQCLDGGINSFEPGFQPHDASGPLLELLCRDNVNCLDQQANCRMGTEQVKIVKESCPNFFDGEGGRRRLLQAVDEIQCSPETYKEGDKCIDCPLNTVRVVGSEQTIEACKCKSGYRKDSSQESNGCFKCRADEAFYCPGGDFVCDSGQASGDGTCTCPANSSTIYDFANQIGDCVAETGFYMQNNEAIECPVLGRAQLTTFQRQGAHTLAACTSVCDAAKYGVDIGGSGGNANCDCDASLFRRWHAESETCMCEAGRFENGGACDLCEEGTFCKFGQAKQNCPANMVSAQGSSEQKHCRCDRGMFKRPDSQTCHTCERGSYCPNGQQSVTCQNTSLQSSSYSRWLICNEKGLWTGGVCPAGEFYNEQVLQDSTAPVSRHQCTNGEKLQKRQLYKTYLWINDLQRDPDSPLYSSLVLNVDLIAGIDTGAIDLMTTQFNDDSLLAETLKRYGTNFQFYGLMGATFQFFCTGEPVLVVREASAGSRVGVESLTCAIHAAELDGLHFVSTAKSVPQISLLGPSGSFDPVSVYTAREVFRNIYTRPEAHVSWATFMDCGAARSVNGSSELQMCEPQCAGGFKVLRLLRKHVLEDENVGWEMPLDVPTQREEGRELDTSGDIQSWYRIMPGGTELEFVFRVHDSARSVSTRRFKTGDVLGGSRHLVFVAPVRVWRFWPSNKFAVVAGICRRDGSAWVLDLQLLHVFSEVVLGEKMHATNVDALCDRSDRMFARAELNLNHVEVFVYDAGSLETAKIIRVLLADIENEPSANIQDWDLEAGDSGSAVRGTDKCTFDKACKVTDVLDAVLHSNCVESSEQVNSFCHTRPLMLAQETDQDATVFTLSTVYKEEANFKLRRRILFEANPLALMLAQGGGYMSREVRERFCGGQTGECSNVAMRHLALVSTPNFLGWQVDVNADTIREDIDVIVALTRADRAEDDRGFLVHVAVDLSGVKDARVLLPFFLDSPITSLRYTMAPTTVHPTHLNVVGGRGRVLVRTQGRWVLSFQIECGQCSVSQDSVFDRTAQQCRCSEGHAPVFLPCKGLGCHENAHGYLAGRAETGSAFVGRDETVPDPDAYINRCQVCGGPVFCVGGTKEGVQRCPAGTYAQFAASARIGDCYCNNGTQTADRGALTVQGQCQGCGAGQICNAVTNTEFKAVACGAHSELVVDTRTRVRDTSEYICRCLPGFYSVGSETRVNTSGLAQWINDVRWHAEPLQSLFANVREQRIIVRRHLCAPCPANAFCRNNERTPCPLGASAVAQSSHLRHCMCPRNYRMNANVSACVRCDASMGQFCVNNEVVDCPAASDAVPGLSQFCPCKTRGFFRVPGSGCIPCPSNHYCAPHVNDVALVNVPVRCPLHSVAKAGSDNINNCTCRADQYKQSIGTGRRMFECLPCPAQHKCDGTYDFECVGARCDLSVCDAEMHAAQDSQCQPGFVAREVIVQHWAGLKASFLFDDHPLSSDYRVAHDQYATYLANQTVQGACVLCPPGLCCSGGKMQTCSTRRPQFLTVMMGAHDKKTHLATCPGAKNVTSRSQRARLGLSSCFDSAMLLATGTKRAQFRSVLSRHPAGAIVFENDPEVLDDTVWKYLLVAEVEQFNRATYSFANAPIHRSELLNGNRMVVVTIDIPRVMARFYARIGSARRAVLFDKLATLDAGTGIAFEALLPCVWALEVNAQGLRYPDGVQGRHFGEAVVVITAVVKSMLALHLVNAAVSVILGAWNECQTPAMAVRHAPRIVFASHATEFGHGGKMLFLGAGAPHLLFAHRGVCAWTNEGYQPCVEGFDGVAISSVQALHTTVALSRDIGTLNANEQALYQELDFEGEMLVRAATEPCPKAMVPSDGATWGGKTCEVCVESGYTQEYFNFESSRCQPCNTVALEDCQAIGKATAIACSFARDAGCA